MSDWKTATRIVCQFVEGVTAILFAIGFVRLMYIDIIPGTVENTLDFEQMVAWGLLVILVSDFMEHRLREKG